MRCDGLRIVLGSGLGGAGGGAVGFRDEVWWRSMQGVSNRVVRLASAKPASCRGTDVGA